MRVRRVFIRSTQYPCPFIRRIITTYVRIYARKSWGGDTAVVVSQRVPRLPRHYLKGGTAPESELLHSEIDHPEQPLRRRHHGRSSGDLQITPVLKLAAQLSDKRHIQIEPLPDIDFNIRSGNTLVEFTSLEEVIRAMTATPDDQKRAMFPEGRVTLERIKEQTDATSKEFDRFRRIQADPHPDLVSVDKSGLRRQLNFLRKELDRYLANEYGVSPDDEEAYKDWRSNHDPFH